MRRSPPTTIGSRALKAGIVVQRPAPSRRAGRSPAVRGCGRSHPRRWRLRWPAHRPHWRSADCPRRSWPRSARAPRRRSRAAARSPPAASCSGDWIRPVPGASPPSSRIRTMAWPPMARPIASMARPFEVVRLSRKPSPASRSASTAWSICSAGSGGSQVPKARMRCGEFDSASCEIRSEVSPLICGPVVARGPGDQDLRLGEQQRAQPVGLRPAGRRSSERRLQFAFWRRGRACASAGSPPARKSRAATAPSSAPRIPGD